MPEPLMSPLAEALWAYHKGQSPLDRLGLRSKSGLFVHCDRATRERQDPKVYYGPFDTVRAHIVERLAMARCRGRVLDVGAGAGRHALHLTRVPEVNEVTALEQDAGLCELMRARGVELVIEAGWDGYLPNEPGYDTVLAMMNGAGLCGSIDRLPTYLSWLQNQLAPGGVILLDTSTVDYLPPPPAARRGHRGHVMFQFEYNRRRGAWFPWLFVSGQELIDRAREVGLEGQIIGPADEDDRILVELYRQGSARS